MTLQADSIDWQKGDGLVPAIVQHAETGRILMLGYMNSDAFAATQDSGRVTFFSRSRQRLWTKGETSGHYLALQALDIDCDRDTLLVQAVPGGPTCHLGRASCFDGATERRGFGFIGKLESIIEERLAAPGENSYTARLAADGPLRLAQKIGEEGVELSLAATQPDQRALLGEAADLLYHVLVLLQSRQLGFSDVVSLLNERHSARTVESK